MKTINENFIKKSLLLAIFTIGFSSLVAQMLLLRELLVVFAGNELSIGVIFANWLILGGLGSLIMGKWAEKIKHRIEIFVSIVVLLFISLSAAIYLARILKNLLDVAIGEGLGFSIILYSSFFILLPIGIFNGALFTLGCRISSDFFGSNAVSIGKVYIYGTIGTIVGGISWTYLLVPFFNAFQISIGLTLLNLLACLVLMFFARKRSVLNGVIIAFYAVSIMFCAYLLFTDGANGLHLQSIEKQWAPLNVVHYQNSIYGNIVVTETEEQYTFFLDGIEHITLPIPNIIAIEEFVHTSMLSHPYPRNLLVLGGGAGGVINEILKHPSVETIDYTELDPLLIELIKKFPQPITEMEFSDKRVNVKHVDGRYFLKTTENKYDLILVGASNPSDIRTNRYFTEEFFYLAQNRLTDEGILVISLPGCLTHITEELRNLNVSIFRTLEIVFSYVRPFPGEGRNLFLASNSEGIQKMDIAILVNRLKERNLDADLAIPWHIERMLHPGWTEWFIRFAEEGTLRTNHDFKPRGVFYSLSHWNTLYAPYLRLPFRWFEMINLPILFGFFIAFIIFFLIFQNKNRRSCPFGIPLCIATTGFAGMVFDLALIFTFQAIYGYVFAWIGLLIATFMTGIAGGAIIMISSFKRIKSDIKFFIGIDLAIICFALVLPFVFILLRPYLAAEGIFPCLKGLFLGLCFISGFLVGAQFPLANRLYMNLKSKSDFTQTAGLIYGADLLGGGIGGIVGGVILLPLLGLLGTCIVIVFLKLVSFVIMISK